MWNLVTLDGYFEGPNSWDLDWHDYAWGEELEQLSVEQLTSADTLLFGRVTYQGMASYWSSATGEIADLMNAIPKIVFSRLKRRGHRQANTVTLSLDVCGISRIVLRQLFE
jgi:dihydrofolate reductase